MVRTSEERLETIREWQARHTTKITLRFNNESDRDIIEKLQSVGNKTEYIRQLIKEDMNKR
ncbi:hypothetical protein [Stecheria intestinalis]|uniref:hypothetical protein n=1 Tax=Stecheria intestinalis TaxID=2606630 RepID=UPI0023F2CB89|nr:hypothetical protein [Stecheria intestinalis]MDD5880996.1 hypothetical protein [Stecheria intestinalis]